MGSNDIGHDRTQVVQQDIGLLVPVRVELHPTLLHEHATEAFEWIKAVSAEVASEFALHFAS
jgi:hypothetical protein